MDQYLLIPFLVGWTSFTSYFDVNYRGTIGFDTLPCGHNIKKLGQFFHDPSLRPAEFSSMLYYVVVAPYSKYLYAILRNVCIVMIIRVYIYIYTDLQI